jgi:2,3-bisphosphoglycerate-independent phosphoglycerate mutase
MRACEVVDECVGRVVEAALAQGGVVLITADHGNADMMVDPETGGPHTFHTTNPVPFILVAPEDSPLRYATVRDGGRLCDISLTVLDVMGIDAPDDMTCRSLLLTES